MSRWARDAIWWQVYPLGFVGAPIREAHGEGVVHRLGRVEAWLDYLIALGANGLLLGPVFASETHGYDTVDHYRIDPRLGDDADFDSLIAAARERGVRVVLDGVFNHVGRAFPQFQAEAGEVAAESFFASDAAGWVLFEGHPSLVTLNHSSPAVADYVADVMQYWLARGADGWRLDAAYAVPAEFWAAVLPRVRAEYPDAWFLGEVIHGDYAGYAARSGIDSVTQYELWKAVWSSIDSANFWELDYALGRHAILVQQLAPNTFVGNHDVTRIASQISDPRHLGHALAVLFTVPGAPSIYAGDEQGLRAVKEERVGGDDAIRPELPPAPAPPTETSPLGLLPGGDPVVLRDHQRLISMRRRHGWLADGALSVDLLANGYLVYSVREREGSGKVVVALNLLDTVLDVMSPSGHHRGTAPDLTGLSDAVGPETDRSPSSQTALPPHGWRVWS